MIISNNLNNQYNNTSFKARSVEIKKTGDICRRVMNEFPVIYSDTKLEKYSAKNKFSSFKKLINFSSELVSDFRDYYSCKNPFKSYFRAMLGMKKHKVGNCQEISDATYIALKLNGYEDVKQLWMYAYNKKRDRMRDLDHVVTGINFKLREGYKYTEYDPFYMDSQYRIYPQNASIIVDSWAGFSEYGKNLSGGNWCIYDRNDLFQALRKNENSTKLLKEDEELCFIPIAEKYCVPEDVIPKFKELFPQLSLNEKFGAENSEVLDLELEGVGLKASEIRRLKKQYKLKSSNPKPSVLDKVKD